MNHGNPFENLFGLSKYQAKRSIPVPNGFEGTYIFATQTSKKYFHASHYAPKLITRNVHKLGKRSRTRFDALNTRELTYEFAANLSDAGFIVTF